jgi:hypothetical protein
MSARTKPRALLLAAALAVPLAAGAVDIYVAPATTYYYVQPVERSYYDDPAPVYSYDEPRIRYEPLPSHYYETRTATVYEPEPIVVTAPRRTEDQAITAEVLDNIAYDPRITNGNIGVETRRGTVELSGLVTTPGQARAARQDAQAVPGVTDVQSTIRSKVGGSF